MLSKPQVLWPDALLLTAMFLMLALMPMATASFEYHRGAISAAQLWRVFTGHFVHLNMAHAAMNAIGTLLVSLIFVREISRPQWWCLVLAAPLTISLGLWIKQPDLQGYVGFSGVLHALLYLGVVRLLATAPVLAASILLLLVSRQVWEQTSAYNPDYLREVIDGRVMPDAHLFGGLTGMVLGGVTLWWDYRAGRLGKANPSSYSSKTGPTPDA